MISRNNYIRNIFKIEVHLSYRWKFNFFTPVKNKSRPSFKDMYKEKREATKKKTGKKLQNSCELSQKMENPPSPYFTTISATFGT